MDQDIRFCTTADGVRIAYATAGADPPLVKAANWLNHLELDWHSPVWRHLLDALAQDHLLVRYDERGNGLSDWNVSDLSFDALVADLEAGAATTVEQSVTTPGMVVGTVAYMAPEVLRGAAADARSDIWSFGVMPYEMLSDRRPFTSTTGFDLPASILFEPLAPLPLAIPEQVRAIVSRRLEKDTGRRYQQAGDVRADLDVASQRL